MCQRSMSLARGTTQETRKGRRHDLGSHRSGGGSRGGDRGGGDLLFLLHNVEGLT